MTSNPSPAVRESLDKARTALKAAFGSVLPDRIVLLGGGISGAYPYRADLGDRSYLVRVEGEASPLRNPFQYDSMWIASEPGIAPKVHFIDQQNGVAVMDFVTEKPLSEFPGGASAVAEAVGELLGRISRTQPFPHFIDYPEMVGRLWWWVCQTGLFADGVLNTASERLSDIRRSYIWEGDLGSCHNDPVPGNMLYDGARLWSVDWESAYLNDPLVDLSIAIDNFVQTSDLETLLLKGWKQHRPASIDPKRLEQVRCLTRLYYAGVFFSAAAAAGIRGDEDATPPTISDIKKGMSAGKISAGSPEVMCALGKLYLDSFITGNIAPPVTVFSDLKTTRTS
jgi:Phosphotransferase enzyme family